MTSSTVISIFMMLYYFEAYIICANVYHFVKLQNLYCTLADVSRASFSKLSWLAMILACAVDPTRTTGTKRAPTKPSFHSWYIPAEIASTIVNIAWTIAPPLAPVAYKWKLVKL